MQCFVEIVAAVPLNVAASASNAKCKASRPNPDSTNVNDRPCEKAIDSLAYQNNDAWTFKDVPVVGTWLAITFANAYNISVVQIMPLNKDNNIRDISVTVANTSINVSAFILKTKGFSRSKPGQLCPPHADPVHMLTQFTQLCNWHI